MPLAATARGAIREAARLDGTWVLVTNDDTLWPADAADACKSLLVIALLAAPRHRQTQLCLLERMSRCQTKEDGIAVGIEIAREICAAIADRVHGFQVSAPFGRAQIALDVLA